MRRPCSCDKCFVGSGVAPSQIATCWHAWAMSTGSAVSTWLRGMGLEILGWILIPLGIILMPLPGPGMLIVAGGVALLSRRHVWAQNARGFVEKRAIDAAKYGVATVPRIVMSVARRILAAGPRLRLVQGPQHPRVRPARLRLRTGAARPRARRRDRALGLGRGDLGVDRLQRQPLAPANAISVT